MATAEVENLSVADLKTRRDELVKALKGVGAEELAARYVQARTDAKLRDERLAEQAATLQALQQGLAAATSQADRLAANLEIRTTERDAAREELVGTIDGAASQVAALEKEIADLRSALAAEKSRADEAVQLARSRRAALADTVSRYAPLLAAE